MKEPEQNEEAVEDVSTESNVEWKEEQPQKRPSMMEMIKAIGTAVKNGVISAQQARDFRMNMGVSQATFTRKQRSADVRKARRATQKASRRANRISGKKGQQKTGRV